MTAYIFFTFFTALTAVYVLFLFRVRSGLRFLAGRETPAPSAELPSVTVLIPARNEETGIAACVASVTGQDYPADRLEIIVVDDHSEDATGERARHDRVRVEALGAGMTGKKDALTHGVRVARGEIILTTDADCRHDPGWVASMAAYFTAGADIVAGPVVYAERGRLFARMQALEFLGLVGVGAGFFGIGYPRLCNGANLAFRRTSFDEVGGYDGNRGIHSGDDEFLLHRIVYHHGGRAAFVTDAAAVVRTEGARTIGVFLRQRVRWASKGRHYEDARFVSFLALLFVYFLFAAAAPLFSLGSPVSLGAGLLLFAVKIAADGAVLFPAAALFRQPIRLTDLLAAELLHAYYIILVSLAGVIGSFTWKNRRLKNSASSSR